MSPKLFLSISAIIGLAYGVAFLLIPVRVMNVYGVAVNPSATMEVRFWGATLTGLGLIFWLARETRDRTAVRAFMYGFAVSNIAGALVALTGTMAGTLNYLGWSAVALYAVLLLGCVVSLMGLARRPVLAR